jgi:hypothetical protein
MSGKQPKLPPSAQRSIRRRYANGDVSLAAEYRVGRSTIHRIIHTPTDASHAKKRTEVDQHGFRRHAWQIPAAVSRILSRGYQGDRCVSRFLRRVVQGFVE